MTHVASGLSVFMENQQQTKRAPLSAANCDPEQMGTVADN
jgi:hypothetical protein